MIRLEFLTKDFDRSVTVANDLISNMIVPSRDTIDYIGDDVILLDLDEITRNLSDYALANSINLVDESDTGDLKTIVDSPVSRSILNVTPEPPIKSFSSCKFSDPDDDILGGLGDEDEVDEDYEEDNINELINLNN